MTVPLILYSDYKAAANSNQSGALSKERIRALIEAVSAQVQDESNRFFSRYYDTYSFSPLGVSYGGAITEDGYLLLPEDLGELVALVNDYTVVIDSADYALFPLESSAPAKNMIKLKNNLFWQGAGPDNFNAIQVSGFWGYGGTFTAKTALTADIGPNDAGLPVASTAALEMGQMLRIGNELLLINAEVTGSPVSVERGLNFSPASEHLTGATVSVFRADPMVRRLVTRIVKWYSALDDNPLIALVTIGDSQEPIDLGKIPEDAKRLLDDLTRPDPIVGV